MATRLADPAAKSKACANCGKIDSAFSCGGCKIQRIGDIQVFYCSQACQKDHWKAHKAICVSRKQLGRAVAIVDELYAAFEEATFDRNSVLQREQNGNIYITGNPYGEAEGVIGKSLIRSFPDEVAPPGTREEILRAILFDSQCDQPGSVGLPVVQLFIKGKLSSTFVNYMGAWWLTLLFSMLHRSRRKTRQPQEHGSHYQPQPRRRHGDRPRSLSDPDCPWRTFCARFDGCPIRVG